MQEYLTAKEVCALIPGMTESRLATLRFRGNGPRYRKPTAKTVVYERSEVIEWIEGTVRTGTASTL
jgi:predicted DNA-binding transcriptional regulator AlpA